MPPLLALSSSLICTILVASKSAFLFSGLAIFVWDPLAWCARRVSVGKAFAWAPYRPLKICFFLPSGPVALCCIPWAHYCLRIWADMDSGHASVGDTNLASNLGGAKGTSGPNYSPRTHLLPPRCIDLLGDGQDVCGSVTD